MYKKKHFFCGKSRKELDSRNTRTMFYVGRSRSKGQRRKEDSVLFCPGVVRNGEYIRLTKVPTREPTTRRRKSRTASSFPLALSFSEHQFTLKGGKEGTKVLCGDTRTRTPSLKAPWLTSLYFFLTRPTTVLVLRMAHRKWKETKQLPSMLPGPAVPGCCLVCFHIMWAILSTSTAHVRKSDREVRDTKSIHLGVARDGAFFTRRKRILPPICSAEDSLPQTNRRTDFNRERHSGVIIKIARAGQM